MPKPPTKAQAIAEALAAKIRSGEYGVGTWLPSERELATEYVADRSTVRRALRLLREQGLVAPPSSQGAKVVDPNAQPVQRHASDITSRVGQWRGFHVSILALGREPFTHTEIDEVQADADLGRWLGVPVGSRLLRRSRVQGVVGDAPVQTSTTYLPWEYVELVPRLLQVDTGPGGMYSRLEEIGHPVGEFEDSVSCRLPNAAEQEVLEIPASEPVLTIWRRAYDVNGRILDVTHRVVVGSRHEQIYRYGPGA
ncbi:GntR family transcriptional regulator [Nonomuraea terrae]|uniref:GntR family transcriptional regulator n=1 Tax=Nonomuraea terrae TaxID=2530383 RepID=A0A4R4ZE19_9ACTN|nr:GntR family transcriptional regulator [Nonomuraea terrae]TDD54622.1 GntR family transcriptional regulator [Nonomuraea terrae]